MCAWASYGVVDGLSPRASPGYGNVRLVSSISCENITFFAILISMHIEVVLAFLRLLFVES